MLEELLSEREDVRAHGNCCPAFLSLPDVQFWRSRKSLEGLSVRSVFFNVFQSFVVLLYILDNETNTVVIISIFVGERRRTISRE